MALIVIMRMRVVNISLGIEINLDSVYLATTLFQLQWDVCLHSPIVSAKRDPFMLSQCVTEGGNFNQVFN